MIHDALAGIPYEHIIILANTKEYGGGGIYNSYTLTTAHHPMFRPVVVHEFGHSFGGLADEYFYDNDVMTDTYPLDVEPWEQNISTQVDFASKWKDMLTNGTPIPTPTKEEAIRQKGFIDLQTIVVCVLTNTPPSALCANVPFAELSNFILNNNKNQTSKN